MGITETLMPELEKIHHTLQEQKELTTKDLMTLFVATLANEEGNEESNTNAN